MPQLSKERSCLLDLCHPRVGDSLRLSKRIRRIYQMRSPERAGVKNPNEEEQTPLWWMR